MLDKQVFSIAREFFRAAGAAEAREFLGEARNLPAGAGLDQWALLMERRLQVFSDRLDRRGNAADPDFLLAREKMVWWFTAGFLDEVQAFRDAVVLAHAEPAGCA